MTIGHEWIGHLCRSECSTIGSYDVLIGMDWLEAHRVKLECYSKNFECMNEEGNLVVVKGIPKGISIRQVSTM